MPQDHAGFRMSILLTLMVMCDTALQKLPSSRKRWLLLTGPLVIACRTAKLRTTSIPWHQANSGHNLIILISGRQMKSLHEGLVTQVTSIWAPSALWKMDRSQNCGWTRQGYLLVLKCLNDGPGKDVSWLVFWNVWIQVKELYQQKTNKANLPDYIEDFSNPNREEHFDSIIKLRSKVLFLCPYRFINIKHNIRIGFGNVKPIKDIYLALCLKKNNICNIILFFLRTRVIRMMRGETTWQWSTFFLDRRLLWVSTSMSININMFHKM